MTDIDVLAARRPDEALAEITRRSGRLRRRRRALQGLSSAVVVAIVVMAVASSLTGSIPSSLTTSPAAQATDETLPPTPSPLPREDGNGGGAYVGVQTDKGFVGVGHPPAPSQPPSAQPAPPGTPKVWMAYIDRPSFWATLYVSNSDGTGRRRLSTLGDFFHVDTPAWSPDGRAMVYSFYGDSIHPTGLRVTSLDGSEDRTLLQWPYGWRVDDVRWSPDGQIWYVYGSRGIGFDLWSVPADGSGGGHKVVAGVKSFDLSADGRRLAVVRADDELQLMDTAGAVLKRLGPARTVALSPDGTRVAVGYQGRVSVMTADGRDRRVIDEPPGGQLDMRVDWQPGGDILAVERQQGTASDCDYGSCMDGGMVLIDLRSSTPRSYLLSPSWQRPALAP